MIFWRQKKISKNLNLKSIGEEECLDFFITLQKNI